MNKLGFKIQSFLEEDPKAQILGAMRKKLMDSLLLKEKKERNHSFAKFFEMLRQYKSRLSK